MNRYINIGLAFGVLLVSIILIALLAKPGTPAFPTPVPTPTDNGTVTEEPTEPLQSSYTNTSENMVVIFAPLPGASIASPLIVSGKARGGWFFEATASVSVVNWDGLIIGQGYVTAQGDWMTEEFVPFTGTIEFETPVFGKNGAVIFQNSNASGLSENDRAVEVPIFFTGL